MGKKSDFDIITRMYYYSKNINCMDKFDKIVELLKRKHEIIDTSILKDKHAEILNNLELGVFNNEAFSLVLFDKGSLRPPHIHDTSSAKFYFLEGKGFVLMDDKKIPYEKGVYVEVPAGSAHGFDVEEDTLMLSIQNNGGILKSDKSVDFRYQ